MQRYYVRVTVVMFSLLLALGVSFAGGGVAYAEPGPRPTLTPIPPVAEPAPAPPVDAPSSVQEADEPPAPTVKPRKAIVVVVTPIAPVQPVTVAPEAAIQPAQPLVQGANFNVRYVTPNSAHAPAAANVGPVAGTDSLLNSLLNNRALLVSLIALDIMAMCIVLRRRFAR